MPADSEYTPAELSKFHIAYFSQLTLYQVLTIIQVILVITTIINFNKNKAGKSRQKTALRNLFIAVLSLGTLVFLLVEWYGIADFLYDFAAMYLYCDIAAILGNLSLMTYLCALYLFFLYRLYATFKDSPFALSSRFIKIMSSITFTTYFILVILVFVIQRGAVKHTPFAWSMKVSEYKPIIICEGEFSIGIDINLRIALQCIVIIGNIYYGYLFYKKLYDLLSFTEREINPHNKSVDMFSASFLKSNQMDLETLSKIYNLMNKQTTLVMVSTVSTSILWTVANVLHFFDSFLQVLVYLDISINCMCLWLMFPWNEKLYGAVCKPCAKLNDYCCSRLFKQSQRLRQIDHAINLQKTTKKEKSKSHPKGGSINNNLTLHIHAAPKTTTFQHKEIDDKELGVVQIDIGTQNKSNAATSDVAENPLPAPSPTDDASVPDPNKEPTVSTKNAND